MREWFRVWNQYGLSCNMSAKNVILFGRLPYDCNVKIYLIECNNCGMTTLGRINIKVLKKIILNVKKAMEIDTFRFLLDPSCSFKTKLE